MSKTKICQGECKRELVETQFYKSNSPLFSDGRVNICKKCLNKIIDNNDINTIFQVLQALDVPFLKNYWEIAKEKNPNNPFGKYITMANSGINEFKGMRWKDSIYENVEKPNETRTPSHIEKIEDDELDVLKEKFGYGYIDTEYVLFEKKYQDLRPSFQLTTTMHEECLREYCIDKVKEGLAKAKGDFKEAKEWASMAKEQASSGKLNPSQMTKSDLSGGLDTFGQMRRMVEETSKGEMLTLLPNFMEKPKDRVDITLWLYVNYIRDLKGLEECEYKDIWEFYNKRVAEYEKKMTDPNQNTNEGVDNGDV